MNVTNIVKSAFILVALSILGAANISAREPTVAPHISPPEIENDNVNDAYSQVLEEAAHTLADAKQCVNCKRLSGTFVVSYERHFGYSLSPENNLAKRIQPILKEGEIEKTFEKFFSQVNLSEHESKRIYCDCAGESLELYGGTFFEIKEARLFAR